MRRNKQLIGFCLRNCRRYLCRTLAVLCLMFWFGVTQIYAQNSLSGVVSDSITGEPIPGANITIKGTTQGTITDLNGNYSIEVTPTSTLVVSFVGYDVKEYLVGDRTSLNIFLNTSVEELEEIMVIGYGTMKRSDVTGAVVSIKEEALRAEVVNSLDQAIQGKAAGVQVAQNSGSPSAATSIRIRGVNSLRNNEPLFVIDGVPVNSDASNTSAGFNWSGGGNGQTAVNVLSTINPADIVSIEILKDASATAIYGSRGANGVVLVTTKKGKEGEATVSYDFSYGLQTPAKLLEVMNLREFAAYQNELADKGYIAQRPEFSDLSLVPENGTNWQKELFRRAPMMDHNLSISGGNKKTRYSISGGFKEQDGMVIGSDFRRVTGRINVSTEAKKWLTLGTNISASRNNEKINLTDSDDGVITTSLLISPYIELRKVDGTWGHANEEEVNANNILNPIAKASEFTNDLTRTRMLGNLWADIKFMPELTLRTELGTDLSFNNNYSFVPFFDWAQNANTVAQSRRQFSNNTFWILKNYLTYDRQMNDHSIKLMLGQESQKSRWEALNGERKGFVTNDIQELDAGGTDDQKAGGFSGNSTQASFFGRANYSFRNRYLATATYRADGSSKFGPNNKWGFFPSFAVAWKINEEYFLENLDWLSKLKLRAGWGQVGNDAIGNYSYGSTMQVRATRFGGGFLLNNIPNPNVKWESTTQWNVGLDVNLFKNRIEVIAEYYQKDTKDMLMILPVPDYLGTLQGIGQGWQGIQPPYSNLGEMENKGVELTLNTVNIFNPIFSWSTSFTFSRNRNKVTALGLETAIINRKVQWYDFVTRTTVGAPVGRFYGYQVEGIFQSVAEVDGSPTQSPTSELNGTWEGDIKFKDLNDDRVIDDEDRTFIGDPNPDFVYGMSNSFTFKSIDLTVYLNGSYGNDIFNFQRIKTEAMSSLNNNQLKTITNRWTPENKDTDMPRLVNTDPNQNARISERYIEDGSYLRISNISLGYRVPVQILSKTPIKGLRVYGKIQNVYTFTNYSGYDPEVGSFDQDALLTGVDNGRFPLPRTFLVGLNVTF